MPFARLRGPLAALALLVALAAPTRAEVLIVKLSPGPGEFSTLQAAIDAADDGDTIAAMTSDFEEDVEIVGKSLMILPTDHDDEIRLRGEVVVRDLPAGGEVLLIAFTQNLLFTDEPSGLRVLDCAGDVTLQGCAFRGTSANQTQAVPGAIVENCAAVSFTNGVIAGGTQFDSAVGEEPEALRVTSSNVQLSNVFVDADGSFTPSGQDGQPGIVAHDSLVVMTNNRLFPGGLSGAPPTMVGPSFVASGDSRVVFRGVQLPTAAPPVLLDTSTFLASPGNVTSMESQAPRRFDAGVAFDYSGPVGSLAFLTLSFEPGFSYIPRPGGEGVFRLGFPLALDRFIPLGKLGVGTQFQFFPTFNIPSVDVLAVRAQLITVSPGGAAIVGAPDTFVLLEAAE